MKYAKESKKASFGWMMLLKVSKKAHKILSSGRDTDPDWLAFIKLLGSLVLNRLLMAMARRFL